MDKNSIELYREHEGTIRVSGSSAPRGIGHCALHYLEKGIKPIDFMCIGGNANQQATKGMGIFRYLIDNSVQWNFLEVSFLPLLYKTITVNPATQQREEKSVTIWRTVLLQRDTKNVES